MAADQTPFADLPAALVEEVLEKTSAVGDSLLKTFRDFRADREKFRQILQDRKLILHESSLGFPSPPTTCGVDGSYAIERLLTTDLAAAAAVAVEGLTPPSEKRHWEQPRHLTFITPEIHHEATATVLRAVMQGNELLLAAKAPHDLIMLDGSFTLPLIWFNQALNQSSAASELQCSQAFLSYGFNFLEAYALLVRSSRSDKNFVALPKYSTRREIGKRAGWPNNHDDRGLLTLLLQPGELTRPIPLDPPDQPWHLNTSGLKEELQGRARALRDEIIADLNRIHVFYYKPHEWIAAIRVEAAHDIATNTHRLASIVQGLKHQCATSAMLEPYPVYLADRTVKALARAVPAFRQVTTQRISEKYEGDIGEVFFAMHGYRSEAGG
jgi:hypothetical protein